MRMTFGWIGVVLVCLAWPAISAAQSITGVARDRSGAVLPGVTVEASSPVLIEKVRVAVTDGSGQYRIIDLRPGTYRVTFTLPGFTTVVREGVELSGEFVATVSADMPVGGLEETITVTGESPTVDVQSAKRQTTLDGEMLQAIPTARGYAGIAVLIPSMIVSGGNNPNTQLSPGMIVFGGAGGRGNEGRVQVDGQNTGASLNGGGVSGYRQDVENAAEIAMTTAGGLGETEVGGPTMNIVPKTGGNTFQSHFFFTGLRGGMQASNYTDELKAAGLSTPAVTNYIYDTSVSVGGPIIRDRLWFYGLAYYRGQESTVPGMFYNKNAGDITKWTYEADTSRPAASGGRGPIQPNLRLTFQVTPRNKVNVFWDEQISNNSIGAGSPTSAPETGGFNHGWQRVQQVKWTSTATNRLLLEAGLGTYLSNWNSRERPGNDRRLIQVEEQCAGGCASNGGIAGLDYRAQNSWNADWIGAHTWNAAATYVTGSHSMKIGYQGAFHVDNRAPSGQTVSYRVNNGVPNRITEYLRDYRTLSRVRFNALYIQDQWTRGRVTAQAALRYDHSWSYYPEQSIGGTRFLPAVTVFPESQGVIGYNDVTPRMGVAYDLFGTGRTALKFNAGRYLEAAVNGNGNYSALLPASRVPVSVTRTWTDANRNFVPDCVLENPLAQDLRGSGGDFCAAISNANFGISTPTLAYDPQIMQGWGVRPGDWQIGVTVQQEIVPRVSLEVGYTRRWLQNFTVTNNLLQEPSDYTEFSITAPSDPRLPDGGGYVISGLYNANPDVARLQDNYRTYAPDFGSISQVYNGIDVNVSARLAGGVQLQAGSSTGQRVTDYCEVRVLLPEQTGGFSTGSEVPAYSPTNPYCHHAPGVTTRVTAAGTYVIPTIDVLLSGTFQSQPGIPLAANYNVPNAVAAAALGRPLSNNAQFVTVNLIEPGKVRAERDNRIDMRIGKILRFGNQRANIALDVYNLLNLDTVLTYNQTFVPGGNWLVPTSVLTARTAKITVQYDF
jgi:hypothetical protein